MITSYSGVIDSPTSVFNLLLNTLNWFLQSKIKAFDNVPLLLSFLNSRFSSMKTSSLYQTI